MIAQMIADIWQMEEVGGRKQASRHCSQSQAASRVVIREKTEGQKEAVAKSGCLGYGAGRGDRPTNVEATERDDERYGVLCTGSVCPGPPVISDSTRRGWASRAP